MPKRRSPSWPEGPGPDRRSRLPAFLRRDPGIVPLTAVGFLAGLIGGAVAFTVASSRGLDSLSGGEIIGGAWMLLALALGVVALARIVMFQDLRIAAVLLALTVGSVAGNQVAFQLLPGTTTDGQLALSVHGPGQVDESPPFQDATCTWSDDRASVLTVTTRRPVASMTVSVTLPPSASDGTATGTASGTAMVTVERIAPPVGTPILRYAGDAQSELSDPSGRAGSVSREFQTGVVLDAPDVPELLRDEILSGYPANALVTVRWDCPQLP